MTDAPVQSITAVALPVTARDAPPEGNKVAPVPITLPAGETYYSGAYNLGIQGVSQIRTLFIDNTENSQALTVTHGVAQLTTEVPAGGGALITTTSSQGNYFFSVEIPTAIAEDTVIGAALYNYEIAPSVWGTQVIIVNSAVPIGSIMIWYGSVATIPPGWGLCNGSTYTRSDGAGSITSPNLEGVFPIGAGGAIAPGATGGSATITRANLPNYQLPLSDPGHYHAFQFDPLSGPGPSLAPLVYGGNGDVSANTIESATTGITVDLGGSGSAYYPPYCGLCFMMKY